MTSFSPGFSGLQNECSNGNFFRQLILATMTTEEEVPTAEECEEIEAKTTVGFKYHTEMKSYFLTSENRVIQGLCSVEDQNGLSNDLLETCKAAIKTSDIDKLPLDFMFKLVETSRESWVQEAQYEACKFTAYVKAARGMHSRTLPELM